MRTDERQVAKKSLALWLRIGTHTAAHSVVSEVAVFRRQIN